MAPCQHDLSNVGTPTKPGAVLTMNGVDIAFSAVVVWLDLKSWILRATHQARGRWNRHASRPGRRLPASLPRSLMNSYSVGPISFPTVPLRGKPIDSAKEPARKIINDREIIFCCMACIEKFSADPVKYNTAINDRIIAGQLPAYPLDNCLASGRPVDVKGTPANAVFGNQLMRFCCGGCAPVFVQNDPVRLKKAVETLEAAYIMAQMKTYPMNSCVISGEPLGESTVNAVVGNRLVRVCNACEKKLNHNPISISRR